MALEYKLRASDGETVRCDGWAMVHMVGKKAAGRLLDGREHNEFPA